MGVEETITEGVGVGVGVGVEETVTEGVGVGVGDGEIDEDGFGATGFMSTPLFQTVFPLTFTHVNNFPLNSTLEFILRHFAPATGFLAAFAFGNIVTDAKKRTAAIDITAFLFIMASA